MRSHVMLATLAAAALAASSHAQVTFAAGGTAAPWIKLASSARVAALADAGSALTGELDAQNLNPAALAGMGGQQFTLMHNIYVLDSSVEHVGYGMGLFEGAGAAVSVDYMNFGAVDKYTVSGNSIVADGSVTPSGWAANLGYGQDIGFGLSAGLNAKMVNEDLGGSAGSAFAGDLGLQWNKNFEKGGLTLAAAYQNIGTPLAGASLPQGLKLGLRGSGNLPGGTLSLFADANALEAENNFGSGGLGLEFTGNELYALRVGQKYLANHGAGGATFGAGLRFSKFNVDYAYVSREGLGAANQISVGGKF